MTFAGTVGHATIRRLAAFLCLMFGSFADSAIVEPFEQAGEFEPVNTIDTLVLARIRQQGLEPAAMCSDEVFLRRVYLDLIGTLPEPREVTAFLKDRSADKRSRVIESLFQREEFADYWSLKWCDLLRVKSEFPVNLWPNAVQAYHRWVHEAMRTNMPMDEFARALLTSTGSNFRVGPVNFYRAVQGRKPSDIAAAVALTFMGARIESWPVENRAAMESFFSRLSYKGTAEWKEEIVCFDPATTTTLRTALPDGRAIEVPPTVDPRTVFADWLLSPENPCLSRNLANRTWYWLMGRGLIHEPDDIRPDNPPSNPELLAYLEDELVRSGFDQRHLMRLIVNSRAYQQSSIPRGDAAKAEAVFACYPVRRLEAEVLIDALSWIGGSGENYESPIPEPFTIVPNSQRTIALSDGSITSAFLELFGRPTRDTGLESERNNQLNASQRLHLLNSSHVQQKIQSSFRMTGLSRQARGDLSKVIAPVYLLVLSRPPTDEEADAAVAHGRKLNLRADLFAGDLAWALVNSKEFLYRH